jgi:type I restriction enzyme, S subunit
MTDLPEGWLSARIPDVFELNPRKPHRGVLPPNARVSFVPMAAVDAKTGTITGTQTRSFSSVRGGYTAFRNGDVIVAKITPCFENGKLAIASGLVNDLGFGSSEFHVLRPKGKVIAEYLHCFLRQQTFREEASHHMTGTAGQARVPSEYLKTVDLPVPPIAEQRRIVTKVERLLSQARGVGEHLARVQAVLKLVRESVPAAACSGYLTEDWVRPGSGESEPQVTPESELQDIRKRLADEGREWVEPDFEHRPETEIPRGWQFVALGNLGSWRTGGTPSKGRPSYWKGGAIPWVSPKDMKFRVICGAQDQITQHALDETRLRVLPAGTLLFVVRGMILAHTFPAAVTDVEVTINQDIRAITPFRNVDPRFLLLALEDAARYLLFAVKESTHGTRRIESETLQRWPIALPSLAEQREAARRAEALLAMTDNIASRVVLASEQTKRLTQSILAKAFHGELVPTEAVLAAREGRPFESATDLLEQVRKP